MRAHTEGAFPEGTWKGRVQDGQARDTSSAQSHLMVATSSLELEPLSAASESELAFYSRYPWCLDVFPTVQQVREYLRGELQRLEGLEGNWQREETLRNIYVLSCAILDSVDDHVMGESYDFSKAESFLPVLRPAVRVLFRALTVRQKLNQWLARSSREWRNRWDSALHEFLACSLVEPHEDGEAIRTSRARLAALLAFDLPATLLKSRIRVPAAFRTQDLTHFDAMALGKKFVAAFPDARQPILIVALRTAGSYLAPVLRAFLRARGYSDVECVTIRPKRGLAPWERARIAEYVRKQGLAIVLDEPPNTAGTLAKTVQLIGQAGFAAGRVVLLLPVHPTRRDWKRADEFLPLAGSKIITLEPEEWHKASLLESGWVEARLQEYLQGQNYKRVALTTSARLEQLNAQLLNLSEEKFHTRLKRIYEVQMEDAAGRAQTRYILAKSVGWGWLGYHAFLAGTKLSEFVPPVLGLREGILFQEWLPAVEPPPANGQSQDYWLNGLASYVAARVRVLGLQENSAPDLMRANRHNGMGLLAERLSQAYAWKPTAALMRSRVLDQLAIPGCPVPTLTDSKMRRLEWIPRRPSPVKCDFEHHGLGKTELNITDPAFDLAEAILYFDLTETEERELIQRYIARCGDSSVEERLFLHKLMAGTWALDRAEANLGDERLTGRHPEFNDQYVRAFQFLTMHTTRFCARHCRQPRELRWKSPAVVMDIDGVLDKQIFGFPSNTAAGIRAISLLHTHGFPVALNTARTLEDVKEYSRSYHCVGGVAEYGSVAWDAVSDRQMVLIGPESLKQLRALREALRQVPGVFLNDDYRYSLRAYVHDREGTRPVPKPTVQCLLARLSLDQLKFFQTSIDTAVVAREVDKGAGMRALLELAGQPLAETFAIGDSDPDLPMFAAATRSYAPAHISCWKVARLLGCRIASSRYQPGLLEIARSIVHPDGKLCSACQDIIHFWPRESSLFARLLEIADQDPRKLLLRAVFHPAVLRTFRS